MLSGDTRYLCKSLTITYIMIFPGHDTDIFTPTMTSEMMSTFDLQVLSLFKKAKRQINNCSPFAATRWKRSDGVWESLINFLIVSAFCLSLSAAWNDRSWGSSSSRSIGTTFLRYSTNTFTSSTDCTGAASDGSCSVESAIADGLKSPKLNETMRPASVLQIPLQPVRQLADYIRAFSGDVIGDNRECTKEHYLPYP